MGLALAAALVIGAVALIGGWVFLLGPLRAGGPPTSVIVDLSGTTNASSDVFLARRGWQIQWQTEADHFQLAIHGEPDLGTAVDQEGPGSGITSPVPNGDFRLEVTADGPWSLRVIQGD
jgi:hypothetical protein